MLLPGTARPGLAACWPLLAAAALLAASPAPAQEGKGEKPPPAKKDAGAQKDEKKPDADVEKARQEVKKLRDEMGRLREEMRQTARKLRKAHATLAEKERRGEGGRFRRRGPWAGFVPGPRPRLQAWGRFGWEGPDGPGHLERKVERLQKEVEQLRRDLKQKK